MLIDPTQLLLQFILWFLQPEFLNLGQGSTGVVALSDVLARERLRETSSGVASFSGVGCFFGGGIFDADFDCSTVLRGIGCGEPGLGLGVRSVTRFLLDSRAALSSASVKSRARLFFIYSHD